MSIHLEFTPEIQKTLNHERYHYPEPRVQQRMEVLWLKSHGLPHHQIAQLSGVCENTLRHYFRRYEAEGIEGLKQVQWVGPVSALAGKAKTLEAHFQAHPPTSVKHAQHEIKQLTGVQRGRSQVRAFLRDTLGLRYRKVGMLPAKADPEVQAVFLAETLEPRLAEAQVGQRAVFFVDAAHFVLAPCLGYLWTLVRLFIRAPAGRQRFNVLGALNAITHELISVTNDTYITSTQVCELLAKLAALKLTLPITLVLDNAAYQRCTAVLETAARLGIELCFLPPYSPNLNLIERLWKFVRQESLASTYYAEFTAFKAAITTCLAQTHTKHKADLDSLLTLNFQQFKKAQFLAA